MCKIVGVEIAHIFIPRIPQEDNDFRDGVCRDRGEVLGRTRMKSGLRSSHMQGRTKLGESGLLSEL